MALEVVVVVVVVEAVEVVVVVVVVVVVHLVVESPSLPERARSDDCSYEHDDLNDQWECLKKNNSS